MNGLSNAATFLPSIIHQKHGLNHDNTKSQIFKVGHEIISHWLPWPKRKMQSWPYLVYLLVNHDRGVCLKHRAECHFSTFPHNVTCLLNYSIYLNHQLQWPCSLYLLCFGWNNIVGVPIFQIPCYYKIYTRSITILSILSWLWDHKRVCFQTFPFWEK